MSPPRVTVCDWSNSGDGGSGLFIGVDEFSCWRHGSQRYAGFWEVWIHISTAAMEVLGWPNTRRLAVVDDFGSLVIVGDRT